MVSDRIQLAKKWWGSHVNSRPAWRTEDLPEATFKDILISFKLAYEVRRGTIVLGKPETELPVLIQSYFWEILSCILKSYAPCTITGISAIHLHLGSESIPKKLDVLTKSSSARIDLNGISVVSLEKNRELFQQRDVETFLKPIKTTRGYPLMIESPESLVVHLRPQLLRDYPQVISAFLKAIDFDSEALRTLLVRESRPIVYPRLADLFEQVGKSDEAKMIRDMVKITTRYSAPSKSQIPKFPFQAALASPKQISDSVYVTRFREQLRAYRDRIESDFKNVKIKYNGDLKAALAYAERRKKYDTYHSSTIEGYRVTEDEIQTLMDAENRKTRSSTDSPSSPSTKEEIERKMALKGYLQAHTYVLKMIAANFKKNSQMTEHLIREIYAHLFSPSSEAGLITKGQLTRYRNDAVYIRNSRYVPPNHHKVDDLMQCLVEEINGTNNSVARAVIAHYGFATVHPYFDGNGRVARLLMNYILGVDGIPWITIRVTDRDKYFRSLETAQCDENIRPFSEFLKRYFTENSR